MNETLETFRDTTTTKSRNIFAKPPNQRLERRFENSLDLNNTLSRLGIETAISKETLTSFFNQENSLPTERSDQDTSSKLSSLIKVKDIFNQCTHALS